MEGAGVLTPGLAGVLILGPPGQVTDYSHDA